MPLLKKYALMSGNNRGRNLCFSQDFGHTGGKNFRYVIHLNHFFGGQEQVFVILSNGNWLFMPYLTALLGVIMLFVSVCRGVETVCVILELNYCHSEYRFQK